MTRPDGVEIAPQPIRGVAITVAAGVKPDPASGDARLQDGMVPSRGVHAGALAIATAASALTIAALSLTSGSVAAVLAALLVVALIVAPFLVARASIRGIGAALGQGFLGYRADDGWPHGVQEDDDMKWDFGRERARET